MLEILCELYFEQKAFSKCLDTGYKLKATYQENEKEVNGLHISEDLFWII